MCLGHTASDDQDHAHPKQRSEQIVYEVESEKMYCVAVTLLLIGNRLLDESIP